MTATVAIPQPLAEIATTMLGLEVESAAVGVADATETTVYVRDLGWLDDDHYAEREARRLAVRSEGWAPLVLEHARGGRIPVWLHTHPGGYPGFSRLDDDVDLTINAETSRLTGRSIHLSIIAVGPPERPSFTARVVDGGCLGEAVAVRVAGPVPGFFPATKEGVTPHAFDRQVRAYGEDGRDVLRNLTVGIVGLGGTGSPTAEQLERLGVGEIIGVDDDIVTDTSVTRGYGSGLADIDRPKVDVAADNNKRIGLGTVFNPLRLNVTEAKAIEQLTRCDLIFCCTDSHHSRLILNRLAYFHLIPVIDMGVVVDTDEHGTIKGIYGRITHIGPGAACLLCRKAIDTHIAQAEQLDPEERRRRAGEGYIPDLDEPAPSVVVYTTLLSASAVASGLHRLFGIGDHTHTETLLFMAGNTIRTNDVPSRAGCFCTTPTKWGAGATDPTMELG